MGYKTLFISIGIVIMTMVGTSEALKETPADLGKHLPANYKEVVGKDLIQCARLISKNNIKDAVELAAKLYESEYDNVVINDEQKSNAYSVLKNLYDATVKVYLKPAPGFSIEDYVFEDFIIRFWWEGIDYLFKL